MARSIFISHAYSDRKYAEKIRTWANEGRLGANIVGTTERADYRAQGQSAIKNELRSMIQGCDTMIVLIGNNTHDRPWVDYEIEVANSKHKTILQVRIPNTAGGPPRATKHKFVSPFDPDSIRRNL